MISYLIDREIMLYLYNRGTETLKTLIMLDVTYVVIAIMTVLVFVYLELKSQ